MIERGETPVYQQLTAILRGQIESGELPAGKPIPSKRVMRATYGVSGQSCDRAVQALKDAGMLRTVRGLGLFVQRRENWTP